ncbi:MAG: DNA methyltransferase [Candidatus Kapabacteria bacterium]|nr:DNA methyltransferase [Candidatus Kapabacteria bacterium]
MNQLFFGDCLDVLKELNKKFPDGFIDLIYIDPPFNSKRNYNILFESLDLSDTKAQKEAFADTWSNVSYYDTIEEIHSINLDLYKFLLALDNIRISKSAVSYLTTMAIRIWYMHKVLNSTGSFYLHCDSTMSHYLKLVCDLVFGYENFVNEIIWKRTSAHNDPKRFGKNADRILFYSKSSEYFFKPVIMQYDESYLKKFYRFEDKKGRFRLSDLTGPGVNPNDQPYKGYNPSERGRSWSVPKRFLIKLLGEKKYNKMNTIQKLEFLDKNGYIHFTSKGTPSFKRYLKTMQGAPAQEIWTDIPPISPHAAERLGYPTQKPEALLERIINASSQEGDIVADFFCGCGTTVAVAERLNRKWLGVDISHLAVKLILKRLTDPYSDEKKKEILQNIEINGFPKDIASAKELALSDKGRVKFQDWIIEFVIGGVSNPKKVADKGFDGYFTFSKSTDGKIKGTAIIEVKSGNTNIAALRSFIETVNQQKADMGIFVCFEEFATKGMLSTANSQGKVQGFNNPKIQILTVEELLSGKLPSIPGRSQMTHFESSKRKLEKDNGNHSLF